MSRDRPEAKKPKYSAPALEKGLDIIEYLSDRDEGENLTTIARGIGKSNSEIFRMLSVLEGRGFVERRPQTDNFVLTDKLFHLGLSQPKKKNLMRVAIPAMEAFALECLNACHLSVRAGGEMVVVARIESPSNVGIAVRVGHHLPMADAPSGRCIAAFSRPDESVSIIADVEAIGGVEAAAKLRAAIREAQKLGYTIMKDGFSRGVTGLSAPVMDLERGECVAAMTSPVLHYMQLKNTELKKIAGRLRFHADTVSKLYSNRKLTGNEEDK